VSPLTRGFPHSGEGPDPREASVHHLQSARARVTSVAEHHNLTRDVVESVWRGHPDSKTKTVHPK